MGGYLLLGLLFVAVVIFVATRPSQFIVRRMATMAAPPEKIFPHLNDLRNWAAWSPWAKLDPNAKMTYSGPANGVGAAMAWDGNRKMGAGRLTVTESKPSELVSYRLEFLRPMRATNATEFVLQPAGGATNVQWTMTGQKNFGAKLFGIFMNFDKMVGGDFERGLANLKGLVEGKA